MNKTIDFSLNNFNTVPLLLRTDQGIDIADSEFEVDLSRLFHHYYQDSYNCAPPKPDHSNFEYLRFLSSTSDFRFLGSGPGANKGKRITISMGLGQAFCRYFLYEFCGVTYFAHMDKVLNKATHPGFNGLTIKRIAKGDTPDYLCCSSPHTPFIAEAKGRFKKNIDFTSSRFDKWRDQFNRIAAYDAAGIQTKLKGYIVATKFATEKNRISNRSTVFAEDPETPGEGYFNDNALGLGKGSIAIHYARILSNLGLGLLSTSLEEGFVVPDQLSYNLPVWRCNYPPLKGEEFVGGFFAKEDPQLQKTDNGTYMPYHNILHLHKPHASFFGLNVKAFKTIRTICLGDWNQLVKVPQMDDTDFRPSNISWLRDGSISGDLSFFELLRIESF